MRRIALTHGHPADRASGSIPFRIGIVPVMRPTGAPAAARIAHQSIDSRAVSRSIATATSDSTTHAAT